MQRRNNSKETCALYARPCGALLLVLLIGIGLTMNGCLFSKSSVTFVNDSDRIAIVDACSPAPWDGILISAGRFEELLDYEDKVLSGDCR